MFRVLICSVFLYQIKQSTGSKFARQRTCYCGEPETLPDGELGGVMNHNFRSMSFRGGGYRSSQSGKGRPKNAIEVREYWKQKIREGNRAKRAGRGRRKRSTSVNETVGSDDDRIVNGYNVDTQPWLASLLHKQYNAITCGGALINKRYVL